MPTEQSAVYWQRAGKVEALLLLACAPFLLFPERFLFATTLALLTTAALWLAPLLLARSPLIPPTPFNLALLLLAAMILVGLLATADPQLTLPKVAGLVLGLSVWRFMALAIRSRRELGWAIFLYLAAGTGFVLVGLLSANWLLKDSSQVLFLDTLLPAGQSPALLNLGEEGIHPNQIAGTITLLLPLFLALLLDAPVATLARPTAVRLLLLLGTLGMGLALLLTQSRSGWLGAAAGIVLLLLLWSVVLPPAGARRRARLGLLASLTFGFLFVAWIGPAALRELWLEPPQQTAVGSLVTLNFRRELWPWALAAAADFPLTGTGLGSFRAVATRLYPANIPPGFDLAHAHNIFLQVALDIGLPGLVAYVALLLLCATVGWQIARRDPALRALSLGLVCSLAALHVYGLADALALGAKPAVLLWGILGFLSVMPRLIK